jgi:predicted dehydrogenase
VVGCGWFGRAHARVYSEISDLSAVCDLDEDLAEEIAEKYDAEAFVDASIMAEEELDSVSVVVPPRQLARVAEVFASRGVDVLVEKPLGTGLDELVGLQKYTEDVRIMPGFIELFNPCMRRAHDALPEIGQPLMASTRRIGRFPRSFWRIGVVLDLALHDLYLLKRLFGDVVRVESALNYYRDDEFEDAAIILLEFDSGTKAVVEANWLTPNKERRLRIYGSEGTVEMDFLSQEVLVTKGGSTASGLSEERKTKPYQYEEPLKNELEAFLYWEQNPVPLIEGLDVLRTALQASRQPR